MKDFHNLLGLPPIGQKQIFDEPLARFDAERASPLIAVRRTQRLEVEPRSVLDDAHPVHPSFDALYERVLRNFTGRGIPKAERMESLSLELLLHPERAALGGAVPLGIPVYHHCPVCGGGRTESFFRCPNCGGDGIVEDLKTLTIEVPVRLARRTNLDLSLENLGICNLFLRVHISVSARV